MNTLTNKDKLTLQVSLALVAGMFSLIPVAQGAPVQDKVVSGGATIDTAKNVKVATSKGNIEKTNATKINSSQDNNIINWKDFSIGSTEAVVFDAKVTKVNNEDVITHDKAHNYLNVVTGNGTSYVDGVMNGGKNVYLVNPNGVIMGKNADVDVGNLYVSTKKLTNEAVLAASNTSLEGASVLSGTVSEEVVNMGQIQANSVYMEGTNIRFLNTANTLDKSVSDTSSMKSTTLLSNPSAITTKTADSSKITLKATGKMNGSSIVDGTGYVHVGYEATNYTDSNMIADYKDNYVKTKKASSLNYYITSAVADTSHDYALVHDANELNNIDNDKSLNYMLANDIDATGSYTPIGTESDPFTGNFDGNYFTVSNISDINEHKYTGLFGKATGTSSAHTKIMNVGVVDIAATAVEGGYVGGVAGYIDCVDLENVYNKSTTVDNPKNLGVNTDGCVTKPGTGAYVLYFKYTGKVGGLVGHASNSKINSVYNTGHVTNGGGLVGELIDSTLTNAYNAGNVKIERDYTSTIDNAIPTLEKHYAIADKIIGNCTIKNVYGAGAHTEILAGSTTADSYTTLDLVPSNSIINGYVIDNSGTTPSITTAINDTISANYKNSNTTPKSYTINLTAKEADNFGFFESDNTSGTYIASSKSSDDVWRIYEGHTLPLLRNFLKANSKGTVPVSYSYSLYNVDQGGTAITKVNGDPLTLSASNADGTVAYNGYYIGITGATTDSVRGLSATKIGTDSNKRAKTVGETLTAFYSTGQDGYDLAGDSIEIVKRSLAPKSSKTDVDKVYDGSKSAAVALSDNLFEKIDLRQYDSDPGYGIVQVYTGKDSNGKDVFTTDNVYLKADFIDAGNTYYVNGPNVTEDSPIHLAFGTAYANANDNVSALDGTAAGNYVLTKGDFNNVTFSGDITQRAVKVSLVKATDLSKVYDGTAYVVENGTTTYSDNGTASNTEDDYAVFGMGNVKVSAKDDTSGLVGDDDVEIIVSDAYYSTDGTKANETINANTTANAYKAAHVLAFRGAADKVGNYKLQDTDGKDLVNNTLLGTGNITKRNVTMENIAFYDGLDGTGNLVDNKKTYDYTSDYKDAKSVSFNSDGHSSVKDAVNQTKTSGMVDKDKESFNFTLDSAKFYTSEAATTEANTVSGATHIKYVLKTPEGHADVLKNYTINEQEVADSYNVIREGQIEKRNITIDMLTATGIDKTYDATKDVVDKNDAKGYLLFQGTGASGTETGNTANAAITPTITNSSKGYVGYKANTAGGHKLVVDDVDGDGKSLNDGTTFVITAEYTKNEADGTGTTKAEKDVYLKNSAPAAKEITYTVSLNGTFKDNYTINTSNDATTTLKAAGTIDQRKITGITFADVEKSYDGSDKVGKVNNVIQDKNKIKVSGVVIDETDGVTYAKLLEKGETLDTMLGTNGGVVSTDNITGTYGKPGVATFEANEHAFNGAERNVQYVGVSSITSDNPNFTTDGIDDVQYGKGVIKPLTIDTITTEKAGKITKVYDGTKNVVGGYQVQYQVGSSADAGDVIKVTYDAVDEGDVKAALGTITGTGTSADGTTKVSVTFGSGATAVSNYGVDTTNTLYNSTHVDEANKIVYAVSLDDVNGDYVLAATGTGYTKYSSMSITNGAKIEKSHENIITPRYIYTQGVTGQSKKYDGDLDVKNSSGTVLTGENVVTFNPKKTVSGLVTDYNDPDNPVMLTNASTAVYSADSRTGYAAKDANIYTDGVQSMVNGAKSVTYTVRLSDADTAHPYGNAHGDYAIYKNTNGDDYYGPIDDTHSYTLDGNDIEQADLTVYFKDIAKRYDTNAYVMNHTDNTVNPPVTTIVTLADGKNDTGAYLTGVANGDTIEFVTQESSKFMDGTIAHDNVVANPAALDSDVGRHTVQYELISTSTDLKNYRLVGSDGTTPLVFSKNNDGSYNVTAYGKGDITPLTIKAVVAAIDAVSKVYDGNQYLTYNHEAPYYDSTQVGSASAKDKVGSITLKTLGSDGVTLVDALTISTGYAVSDDNTIFDNANVGTGKTVTYSITINKDIVHNLDLDSDLGNTDEKGNFTFTQVKTGNSITAKNAYAYLNSTGLAADPTKTYNGNTSTNGVVSADTAKTYVTINGLVNGDSYIVSSAYESSDVAVDADGKVVASKNKVDYTVTMGNNNYNLYTVDDSGNIFKHANNHAITDTGYNYDKTSGNVSKDSDPDDVLGTNKNMATEVASPTHVLVGKGTITPKEITITASMAQKTYDATADVKEAATETGDEVPIFTLHGLVDNDDLVAPVVGTNAVTGEYVTDKDGKYVADENVELDGNTPTYKAVRYSNLVDSITAGNSKVTNYKLVNDTDDANSIYTAGDDTNKDTLLLTEDAHLGKITKRSISSFTEEWGNLTKEYDATDAVQNPTEGFKVYGVSTVGNKTIKIPVAYTFKQAVYGTLNSTQDGLASTRKDVGNNLDVAYEITGLKEESLQQNFELDSNVSTAGYEKWFTTNTGKITPRVISGKATTALQNKTYDGDTDALSNSTYFNFDEDDLAVLSKDGKNSSVLTVSGAYANKNANINPTDKATGGKNIYYTMAWATGQEDTAYQNNYSLAPNNGTGDDYIGQGDIRRRVVYVTDTGGKVLEKTYDGTAETPQVDGGFNSKFGVADADDTTGIIDSDVALSVNNVTAAYVSDTGNVARDANGKVVNQAVQYTGNIGLVDGDQTNNDGVDEAANYYLKVADDAKVTLTDSDGKQVVSDVDSSYDGTALTIIEKQGGRINPIKITIGLTNSPTKTYDTKTSVTGNYNDDVPYASVSNLKAASDKASTTTDFQSVNDSTLELTLNPRTDVNETVKVTMSGGNYSNKNAGSDKVTSYTLTWDNPNYELVGETTTTNAGQDEDTFDVTSYDSADPANKRVSGILKDYRGTITPFDLSFASMDSSKTYDGNTDANVPDVTVTFSDASKNMLVSDGANINNMLAFLGFKVTGGTYGGPTDEALAAAEADGNISDGDIATTTASDASFNEKSAPFVHKVTYDGISITNGNYRIGDSSFAGTGTINRAPITAKANDALVKVGEAMPKFSGTMFGFVSKTDADYYNGFATWGPEAGVSTGEAGTNPVYGWYRNLKSGVNMGKNYVLEYQQPGTFTVETEMTGDVIGYVDKPVVPDNKVYQSVSKDENKSHNHEPKAAIQYGNTGTGIVADRDEGGSSGTIAIELAEVVNLLGGEVASDGTMSLANQERKSSLSVGSTSEGFLSVGNGDNEASGQTDLFSEGEIAIENKDGEIGLENEENLWQGQAELAMAEGSILSDGQIVNEEDEKDKDKKKKTLEEKNEHEASATITYGDVA